MSGIAVVLGAHAGAPGATPEWMLHALQTGASDRRIVMGGDDRARLAVTVPAGRTTAHVFAADAKGRIAVADATLYYGDDLRRALRAAGVAPSSTTLPELLLAAYDAWGEGMAQRLEGDFAFAVWDAPRSRLVVARDFSGRRPLFFVHAQDTLLVASAVECLLAHPSCSHELDLTAIAANAAALLESPGDTAYRAIRTVGAGSTMSATVDQSGQAEEPRSARHWSPPTFEQGGSPRFAEAAEELRATLVHAVAERLDDGQPTAVWLSGGWDSTAVFAAGCEALRAGVVHSDHDPPLRTVSVSYPEGDPAREDELIAQVTAHWQASPHWCEVRHTVFGDAVADAVTRALPFVHPYAEWTRTLSRATHDCGTRVALDGTGGDQLFQVSPVYVADLVVRGRWLAARREWRARSMQGSGWRRFARYAVLPWLPSWALRAAARARGGRPVHGLRSRELPPWITPTAVRAHDLASRATLPMRRRRGESQAAMESRWYFESGYSPAILAEQSAVARAAGVEIRSPLYDGRVIALAARRPRQERSSGGETKRLLREAMRGLLPEDVLAPRTRRTGTTAAFFRRAMERELPALAGCVLESSRLAEHGIVDPDAFAAAMDRYLTGAESHFDVALFQTVQTELWLRAREQSGVSLAASDAAAPALSLPS